MKRSVILSIVFLLLLSVLVGCSSSTAEAHEHLWVKGKCFICGIECEHDFSEKTGFCSVCGIACAHEGGHDSEGVCAVCGQTTYHDYRNGVCTVCGATTNISYSVPESYQGECEEKGTIVSFTYHTLNYSYAATFDTELVGVTKECYIYLPYGYNEETQYNIIYLLHGQVDTAEYWLVQEEYAGNIPNYTANVLDHMIRNKDIEPVIVVTPDIHTDYEDYDDPTLVEEEWVLAERNDDIEFISKHATGVENNEIKFYETVYYREIKDMARQIESVYSTYAGGDVSDAGLTASRAHRAVGGFSVGGNISLVSIFSGAYDFIGFYGSYSGASLKYKDYLLNAVEEIESSGYSIYLFLSTEEKTDGSEEIRELYRELTEADEFYAAEKAVKLLDIRGGTHEYPSFMAALYNSLHFFFLEDPSSGNVNS